MIESTILFQFITFLLMHPHLYRVVLFADDMGALDIVSRLRLSKLLDVGNKWEQLASALGKI